jgi:hypothetical protein
MILKKPINNSIYKENKNKEIKNKVNYNIKNNKANILNKEELNKISIWILNDYLFTYTVYLPLFTKYLLLMNEKICDWDKFNYLFRINVIFLFLSLKLNWLIE